MTIQPLDIAIDCTGKAPGSALDAGAPVLATGVAGPVVSHAPASPGASAQTADDLNTEELAWLGEEAADHGGER